MTNNNLKINVLTTIEYFLLANKDTTQNILDSIVLTLESLDRLKDYATDKTDLRAYIHRAFLNMTSIDVFTYDDLSENERLNRMRTECLRVMKPLMGIHSVIQTY